jgi:uncharacterized protein
MKLKHFSFQFIVIATCLISCFNSPKKFKGQTYVGEITSSKRKVSVELIVTMDQKSASISSSLGLRNMQVSLEKLDEDSLIFTIPSYSVSYRGKFSPNLKTVEGIWNQGPKSYQLIFELEGEISGEKTHELNIDFEETELMIDINPIVHLAGTLTMPKGKNRHPAIILLGVAGKTDRDQSFGPYSSFKIIAERLTQSGFAVLRCDDRGVGGSSGSLYESSYEELATDALAMIAYLRERPEINPHKVGVLGISEGAALGGILAGTSQLDFAVLLSYPAQPGITTIRQQIHSLSTIYKFTEQQKNLLLTDFETVVKLILKSNDPLILKGEIKNHLEKSNPETKALTQYLFIPQEIEEAVQLYSGAWYRSQLEYDPTKNLSTINCPVLIMYGDQDPFVNPDVNVPILRQDLKIKKNIDIETIDSINHIFQDAPNGSPLDYINNNNAFSERALTKIEAWLIRVASENN